jgi:hypothetical protein
MKMVRSICESHNENEVLAPFSSNPLCTAKKEQYEESEKSEKKLSKT